MGNIILILRKGVASHGTIETIALIQAPLTLGDGTTIGDPVLRVAQGGLSEGAVLDEGNVGVTIVRGGDVGNDAVITLNTEVFGGRSDENNDEDDKCNED